MNWESIFLDLLQDKGQLTSAIGLIIVGAFLIGALAALGAWLRLHREASALEQARARCHRLQEREITSGAQIMQVLTEGVKPANSLVCNRIYDLQEIRHKGGEIDRDALTATTVARLSVGLSLPRYVTSILILIGLMGTLLGLTRAVIGLSTYQSPSTTQSAGSASAQSEGPEALRDRIIYLAQVVTNLFTSIEHTLSGMRMAFVASLIAIALTIVLSFVTHGVQNYQTHFLADLEDFTTKELMPLFLPLQLEGALHNLGVSLQEGIGGTLKALAASLQDGTEQLATVVEEIDDRTVKTGSNLEYLFMLVHEFDASRKRFEDSIDKIVNGQKSLIDGQYNLHQTAQRFADAVERLSGYEATMHKVLEDLEPFCAANANLQDTIAGVTTSQQALQEELQRFVTASEDLFTRRLTNILGQEQQREAAKALQDTVQQGLSQQRETAKALQDTVQQGLSRLLAQQQNTDGIFDRMATSIDSQQAVLHSLGQTMRENITVQKESLDTLQEFVRRSGEQNQVASSEKLEEGPMSQDLPLANLNDMLRKYLQVSLSQQQQIIKSLDLMHTAIVHAAESPMQVWLERVRAWWQGLRWRFRR